MSSAGIEIETGFAIDFESESALWHFPGEPESFCSWCPGGDPFDSIHCRCTGFAGEHRFDRGCRRCILTLSCGIHCKKI